MRLVAVITFSLTAALVAGSSTGTTDVNAAESALGHSAVYIAPGTPNTDASTATSIEGTLRSSDIIKLALFPSDSSVSAETVAKQIASSVKKPNIVAVAIGDDYAAYSASLPSGVAAQQMTNAATVSATPVATLQSFVVYMHNYLDDNQGTVKAPAVKHHAWKGWPWLIGGLLGFVLLLAAAIVLMRMRQHVREVVKYSAPAELNDDIRRLMNLRQRVRNKRLQDGIDEVCRYTETYFKKLNIGRRGSESLRETAHGHLQKALDVVTQCIKAEQNPTYFDDPKKVITDGTDAITGLAEALLKNIKQSNRNDLVDFTVNTKILSAERYK